MPTYRYLSIRSDEKHSQSIPGSELQAILDGFPQVERESPGTYNNKSPFPWIKLYLVTANEDGNFTSNGELPERVNLLSIIALTDGSAAGDELYDRLAEKIASAVDWAWVENQ